MKFISYCWNIGTTSFRVKDLNLKIEQQLTMLSEVIQNAPNAPWKELEIHYYDSMVNHEFIKEKKSVKEKEKEKLARQKSSALVEVGLVTVERQLTSVGQAILNYTRQNDFSDHNIFHINKDSFLYLKQMMKYQTTGGSNQFEVKPFIVLLVLLSELEYLTTEEVTYILPLCKRTEEVYDTIDDIRKYRAGECTIDEMIHKKMLSMDNYQECLSYMMTHDMQVLEEFVKVEMNRKGSQYSKPYQELYLTLEKIRSTHIISEEQAKHIFDFMMSEYKKNIKTGKVWRDALGYKRAMKIADVKKAIENTVFYQSASEEEMKRQFFLLMNLAKWKGNLADYYDLNQRFFQLTDIILFQEDKIYLDLFPKYYFKGLEKDLIETPFLKEEEYTTWFQKEMDWEEIYPCLRHSVERVYDRIRADYPECESMDSSLNYIYEQQKKAQFRQLVEKQFPPQQVIKLLRIFQSEQYDAIVKYTDWTATPATIFEYLLAIAWYHLSKGRTNMLEAMRLSLDANLYPKSHAAGGDADLICSYEATNEYEAHTVLLEATLTKSTNQRKSEMEPVSRHMMRYLQESDSDSAYALFVAPYLSEEVLSDFRNKKTYQYRAKNGEVREGIHIVAMDVEDLIYLLEKEVEYPAIYQVFDEAIKDREVNDLDWYRCRIKEVIHSRFV